LQLRSEPVDMASVIDRALETSRPLIRSRRHELRVDVTPEKLMVEGDALRLAQVVGNLLNNAAKYTPPGGTIEVSLRRDADSAVLSVRDSGAGIPEDKLESVFDMFSQVDASSSRSQGGLGVGLSLVRRIVDLHGGSVYALSDGPGKGSNFVVRLPVRAQTSPASRRTPVPQPHRRIVVVDDNRDAADTTRLLLELMGNEVWVAYDGMSGLELCGQHRPDVVLLDLGMPELDGYEVARRLRRIPEFSSVLLIALTGWGQLEDRRAAREAGFDVHLIKPVSLQDLQVAVETPIAHC
jgi:CheY-like chemotaxis protein